MADVNSIVADVVAALEAIPITVYDGYVPKDVPTDSAGYVRPYVVVWAGAGDTPEGEVAACGSEPEDGAILDIQTTVVGANPDRCRRATTDVIGRLRNLPLTGGGTFRKSPDGFNQEIPILDNQITPVRYYLPKYWRAHQD